MFVFLAAHEFNKDNISNIIINLKEHAITDIKATYINRDIT